MADATAARARAAEIADDVLFPAALDVDRADRVPASHLDLLATAGLYGVAAPPEHGGLGFGDFASVADILATLAGGCLATAFVWLQHLGPVVAAAHSDRPGVTEGWLGPLTRGERRAGIALAGLRAATPVRVRQVDGGFVVDGSVPWVTGWDMIDTVHLAALDGAGLIHYFFVDAQTGPTLTADLVDVVATQSSRTVHLHLVEHLVPADRLVGIQPFAEWSGGDAAGALLNGFLAIGVAARCCRLLGPSPFDDELAACRAALLAAAAPGAGEVAASAAARAEAADLALRASAAVVVRTGSRAVRRDQHAQRLAREAMFLLVFGSRPVIRDALLARLEQDRGVRRLG